jgi:hypothetical protein
LSSEIEANKYYSSREITTTDDIYWGENNETKNYWRRIRIW